MGSTYLTLDDPQIELRCTRPGRVYSLNGKEDSPEYPYPPSTHTNGFRIKPRMGSVFSPLKSFNLDPGDHARLTAGDTPLLGIVLELADHHIDLRILIGGEVIYQDFGCLSCYLPSSVGTGQVHWLVLEGGIPEQRLSGRQLPMSVAAGYSYPASRDSLLFGFPGRVG